MVAAVAAFAVTDAFIKGITRSIPVGQALLLISLGNLVWFLPRTLLAGHRLFSRDALAPAVVIRSLGEASGSFGIVAALAVLPLATVSAIMQAQPLVVMMVAAIFLGEEVGWRRWVAVGVGFAGVLVILRPDASFDLNMLWPLFGVIGLTARDIGTRILPRRISADFAITWAVILLVALGAGLTLGHGAWVQVDALTWGLIAGATVAVTLAFILITEAFRTGEVSVIAPFRYTRMVFALAIAMLIFGERPDAATWLGIALIVGSGLYAFWREQRAARQTR